jgi:adenylate kinase family enzyme
LIAREDDQEATIRQRLRAYHELTGPILQWYGPSLVRKVDGGRAPEVVAKDVERLVLEASV